MLTLSADKESYLAEQIDNFEESMFNLEEQFIIGTLKGSFLHKLADLFEVIVSQVLQHQLRLPIIHDKSVVGTTVQQEDKYEKIIDLSRPSDYRMRAIEAKNLSANATSDDGSHASGASRMSTVATVTSSDSVKACTPYEGELISKPFPKLSSGNGWGKRKEDKYREINWLIFLYISNMFFLIEPTPPSHDDKWNQLYAKAEQDAEKERASQKAPVKKSSTMEILQSNLDEFRHTIEW
jgi:hypothetical protein